MAERRVKQWAIAQGILEDIFANDQQRLAEVVGLLYRHGVVPREAVCTHCFVDILRDMTIVRFRHASFPEVPEYAPLDTVYVTRAMLGRS
jgi:hypothetical protein